MNLEARLLRIRLRQTSPVKVAKEVMDLLGLQHSVAMATNAEIRHVNTKGRNLEAEGSGNRPRK